MAQYTVTAFQWVGYHAQYASSHTATFNDDDENYEGRADTDETISIDGGAFNQTSGNPWTIKISFTDTSGDSHVEAFQFFHTDGNWYFTPGPDSAFTVGATMNGYQSHTLGWQYDDVICFAAGTRILTDRGAVAVEKLRPGARVAVADAEFRPLRLNLHRSVSGAELAQNPRLRPVRIIAGALGIGLPVRDLLVSRQHRMQVSSRIAERMFGTCEVLVAAIRLTALPGIHVDDTLGALTYHHLVFDAHELVFAEGAPAESLFTGAQALKALTRAARRELLTLWPQIATPNSHNQPQPACRIPANHRQKQLIARHLKNRQALVRAVV